MRRYSSWILQSTVLVFALLTVVGILIGGNSAGGPSAGGPSAGGGAEEGVSAVKDGLAKATFAGGCFWCMEPPFDKLDGVVSTTSGYTGGKKDNPTYKQVSSGRSGHTEVVQVVYDPSRVSYEALLQVFWRNIDPTVKDRQFCDWGTQYRTGIFYHNEEQQRLAEQTRRELEESGRFKKIHTEVTALAKFFPAEDYHQDYYKKDPVRYKSYRYGCGRDKRLKELWGE